MQNENNKELIFCLLGLIRGFLEEYTQLAQPGFMHCF